MGLEIGPVEQVATSDQCIFRQGRVGAGRQEARVPFSGGSDLQSNLIDCFVAPLGQVKLVATLRRLVLLNPRGPVARHGVIHNQSGAIVLLGRHSLSPSCPSNIHSVGHLAAAACCRIQLVTRFETSLGAAR